MTAARTTSDAPRFLVLRENRLAVAAVRKLAPGPRRRAAPWVTLVGPPGVGKSHLARDLARLWSEAPDAGAVRRITAAEFHDQFSAAAADGRISQFQTRYRRSVKLLICEDLQTLTARPESQQQLLAALDEVSQHLGCVLLTANAMPGEIKNLSSKLVNRIHGGVCVAVELPGEESRRRLLRHFLQHQGLALSATDVELLAQRLPVSPRELLGAVHQLQSIRKRRGVAPRGAELLSLLDRPHPTVEVSLNAIARAVADQFGLSVADLRGPQRSQTVSLARQVAMSLGRQFTSLNYAEIGDYFNRSNHSTVIHACRKVAAQRTSDPRLELILQNLLGQFASSSKSRC